MRSQDFRRETRLLLHKQVVMRSVWNSPITKGLLPPETRRVCAETEAREKIVSSLLQSLSEVKTSKTKAQLATKHAILTAVVTNGTQVSARQTTRLLGVHHRNVAMAAQRRATMVSAVHIQWTLSVRKTRSDATTSAVKDIVTAWWVAETRPIPNRKEVVRKWVAPKTYVEHHAQYLLESLVSARIHIHYFVSHFHCLQAHVGTEIYYVVCWICFFGSMSGFRVCGEALKCFVFEAFKCFATKHFYGTLKTEMWNACALEYTRVTISFLSRAITFSDSAMLGIGIQFL